VMGHPSPMVQRVAKCSCEQLSATCTGEPVRVSVCHCLACKRRTGSAFSWNARFDEKRVEIRGRSSEFVRIGDEGSRVAYRFCPECGTTVFYQMDTQPGLIAVPVGGFAEVSFPKPFVSVYHESRRCGWVDISAEPLDRIG
jgi:hypothetical protein